MMIVENLVHLVLLEDDSFGSETALHLRQRSKLHDRRFGPRDCVVKQEQRSLIEIKTGLQPMFSVLRGMLAFRGDKVESSGQRLRNRA